MSATGGSRAETSEAGTGIALLAFQGHGDIQVSQLARPSEFRIQVQAPSIVKSERRNKLDSALADSGRTVTSIISSLRSTRSTRNLFNCLSTPTLVSHTLSSPLDIPYNFYNRHLHIPYIESALERVDQSSEADDIVDDTGSEYEAGVSSSYSFPPFVILQ
ncbi:hypothetical protein BKA70DRAFT_1435774 [Coprinopsis sp. MPI-PUGE-AT-0042]|nr:hypothetical protein BKA70DRAFT_1435774 [Coprinopsis sp. MPI-PUGE-AT-0042]